MVVGKGIDSEGGRTGGGRCRYCRRTTLLLPLATRTLSVLFLAVLVVGAVVDMQRGWQWQTSQAHLSDPPPLIIALLLLLLLVVVLRLAGSATPPQSPNNGADQ